MEKSAEYEKQLSEIHEIISESRHRFTGGGPIALVWGVLSMMAIAITIMFPGLGSRIMLIWAAHNVLGWTFTLMISHHKSERLGLVSLRGRQIIRTWAVCTLAVWIVVAMIKGAANAGMIFPGIMSLIIGMGIFVTGLIGESRFSQIVGVATMSIGPGVAIFAPKGLAYMLAAGSMAVILMAWGIGSWVVREN